LIGAETRTLVRDAVRVDPVDPLTLKGKAEPVEAFRLLEVLLDVEALARHPEARLVGRQRERNRLWRDFEDVLDERSCRLVTLLGPAGIGKSRLVADFLERVGEAADVLRGRCLSYGEGITYWPLVEILIGIGVDPESIIGSSPEETRLTFRRLLETRAARPQVVVIDDLQWAEPAFVDLVEHVADFSRDAPILLLCVARMELLELRPGWGGGKLNATSVMLEPLKGEECDALIDNLLEGALLDEGARDRIAAASQGNPLFVEEMLAMVREQGGDGEIVVPPTIHALLQARLDTLGTDERLVIERGAVEGEVFHRGAVAEMAPGLMRPALGSHLTTLVRKELIRSVAATFPDDEGFRFRHLLIRDAAYESLPKAIRAELHERFADWLGQHELIERDEILGYHLEQAHRYRSELDLVDPLLPRLAARTSEHLAAAGQAAFDRGDYHAGCSLYRRATRVLPPGDDRRFALAPDFVEALFESGEIDEARAVLAEARGAQEPITRALVAVTNSWFDYVTAGDAGRERRKAWREEARIVFEGDGHDYGLALYWWSVAHESWGDCRADSTAHACERALDYLERTGTTHIGLEVAIRGRAMRSLVFGPTPVVEAIERVQAMSRVDLGILFDASTSTTLGILYAMNGETERAREHVRVGRQAHLDAGMLVTGAAHAMSEYMVEQRAGDLEAAETSLREGLDVLGRVGDRSWYPTAAVVLARVLYEQGRYDEAQIWCDRARETTVADDLVNFVFFEAIEGCVLARRGKFDEAEKRARSALERSHAIDFTEGRAFVRALLAEVLALAGKTEEAAVSAQDGLSIREAKGDIAAAARERRRLSELGIDVGRSVVDGRC
ncbi:MAG: AAA family ATPase, partial [Gaiellaceae bacterium]